MAYYLHARANPSHKALASANMLLSRADIRDLVNSEPQDMQALLLALIWHATRGNPNVIDGTRYGIALLDLQHAQAMGFTGAPERLLDPSVSIPLASACLRKLGLVQYAGFELAPLLMPILALSREIEYLRAHPSEASSAPANPMASS